MGKHLDNVIELEYEQIINAHPEELTPSQKASIRQGLQDNLKSEMKEEMLYDITKAVEKDFETRYEEEKVENIKALTIVGVILSFFVGLAVNQCTECLAVFKYLFPIIFFPVFSYLVLVILLRYILKTISNTFSTKESYKQGIRRN